MKKVLITYYVHPVLKGGLIDLGFKVVEKPEITYAQLIDDVANYEGIIVHTKIPIDETIIDAGKSLKFIGRVGSGMEHINVAYAIQKNIACLSSPEGNKNAVAEHALGLLLALLNNINVAAQQVKKGSWLREENRGVELEGKTIGIIGFGNTGTSFAQKLAGFDVKVLAYDKYSTIKEEGKVNSSTLENIFKEADIISLHIPNSNENYHFADSHFFNSFKKPIVFINCSRGKNVNTLDLLQALKAEKVIAAGLDVLENEKLSTYSKEEHQLLNELTQLPNVIITPHVAGWSAESKFKLANVLLNKIKEHYQPS